MISKNSEISPLIWFAISIFASSLNKFPSNLFLSFIKIYKLLSSNIKAKFLSFLGLNSVHKAVT